MCVIFFRLALSCKRIKITLFLQHHNLIWRLCTSFKSLFMRVNRVAARVWAHLCSVAISQTILYRPFFFNIMTLFDGFVHLLRAYSCVLHSELLKYCRFYSFWYYLQLFQLIQIALSNLTGPTLTREKAIFLWVVIIYGKRKGGIRKLFV